MDKSDRNEKQTLWTIGHSTRTAEELIESLKSFGIRMLADVRSYPGSSRYPHFNKLPLTRSLEENGIAYIHLPMLGGRRSPKPDSVNTGLRSAGFRGFADYMGTFDFRQGIENLLLIADEYPTAILCAEKHWQKCHRSLISDYLLVRDVNVIHIADPITAEIHQLSKRLSILDGNLIYA